MLWLRLRIYMIYGFSSSHERDFDPSSHRTPFYFGQRTLCPVRELKVSYFWIGSSGLLIEVSIINPANDEDLQLKS